MSVWSDDEVYAKLAIAAEALAKNTAQKLPLDQTKRAGRAIQALMAEPTDAYRQQLEQVPKLRRDAPNDESAGLDIIRLLANKEANLTNKQSTGPAMEFHHLTHNAALYDATKYLPQSTLAMFHDGYQKQGFGAGASPDAGVVLSRYGHRLAPNSAHVNPETGGNYTMYYGTQPLDIDPSIVSKDEQAFAKAYLESFIDQKAKPMYKAGIAAYNREGPLRDFLDSVAGGPVESFKSPAVYKQRILDAGITESDVDRISKELHGKELIQKPVGRTTINTPSWRKVRRPGAEQVLQDLNNL